MRMILCIIFHKYSYARSVTPLYMAWPEHAAAFFLLPLHPFFWFLSIFSLLNFNSRSHW